MLLLIYRDSLGSPILATILLISPLDPRLLRKLSVKANMHFLHKTMPATGASFFHWQRTDFCMCAISGITTKMMKLKKETSMRNRTKKYFNPQTSIKQKFCACPDLWQAGHACRQSHQPPFWGCETSNRRCIVTVLLLLNSSATGTCVYWFAKGHRKRGWGRGPEQTFRSEHDSTKNAPTKSRSGSPNSRLLRASPPHRPNTKPIAVVSHNTSWCVVLVEKAKIF